MTYNDLIYQAIRLKTALLFTTIPSILLLSQGACRNLDPPVTTGYAAELLELSRSQSQLRSTGRMFADSLLRSNPFREHGLKREMNRIIRENFDNAGLYAEYSAKFAESLPENIDYSPITQWLRSPGGRKATALELQASSRGQDEFIRYLKEREPVPPSHMKLVRRYIELTNLAGHAPELATGPAREMTLATQKSIPAEYRLHPERLDRFLSSMKKGASLQYDILLPDSIAFTYSGLSEHEFQEMLDAYDCPAGNAYLEASWKALIHALNSAAEKSGAQIGKLLTEQTEKCSF